MAISTNGTVIARLAGGLYNTVMSNATYLEVASQDPSTLANTLYARDFAKSTDLAVATTLVTNLGLSSVAGLANWVAAQLTAAGAANKGAKIVSLLNDFAGMTADTTYGAQATAFNTKVDAALAASQKTGAASGVFADAGTVAVTNATFTLTSGTDTGAAFTGGAGNDTFNATNAALNTLDSIDGGAGTDTLNITDSVSIPSAVITAANIETLNVTSTAGSVGAVAADAAIAVKEKVTYTFTSTYGTSIGVGPVKVTVGGASINVGTETTATAQTIDKLVAAINQLAGSTIAANSDSSNTGATGTIVVTAATAGTALPTIKFENGSYTPPGSTTAVVPTTDVDTTAGTNYSFKETIVANQAASAAVDASTFSVPTGVTTANISAATSAKIASVSTAATTVSGTDVTLSGGSSQTVTAAGSVYASGSKGAISITNAAKATNGFYVASSSTTGLNGGWGTSSTDTVAGTLITGGSTVSYTGKGATITSGVAGSANATPTQVGSAANKSSAGSLTGTETIRNLALDPTGDVTIATKTAYTDSNGYANVAFGTGTAKVYTNGSTSVSVTGAGTTTITDVGTTTLVPSTGVTAVAGTSKLANVTLSGLSGNATITSDAINTVTVTDTLSARTVTVANSGTTGANTGAINLVVSNAGTSGNAIVLDNATTTTVNISSASASAYAKIGSTASNSGSKSYVTLTTPKATSVNLSNSLSVDIGDFSASGVAKVASVNGANATGGITAVLGDTPEQGMAFTGGSGADTVTLKASTSQSANSTSAATTTVKLGAGNDKLLNDGVTAHTVVGASFDGGDGNDSVELSLITVGNASQFTNFETLILDLVADGTSRDVSILGGITGLNLGSNASGSSEVVTYTGVTTSQGLTVSGNLSGSGTSVLDFGSAVTGTADAYTLTFAATGTTDATATPTAIAAGKVQIAGIENITVASGGSGYTNNTIALSDTSARTLTITGNQKTGVTFAAQFGTDGSSTSSAGVSLIDASALTGKFTLDTTNIKTAYAGVTVKGGTNDDNITITAQSSGLGRFTVDAGAGNDTITTSTAASTLTGGAGNDTFDVTSTVAGSSYASAPIYTTITDFAAGDSIKLGTTTVSVAGKALILSATSLTDALNTALSDSSVTAGKAVWFVYGGNTYVANEDSTDGLSANDIIVKLTGAYDLTWTNSGSGLIGVA